MQSTEFPHYSISSFPVVHKIWESFEVILGMILSHHVRRIFAGSLLMNFPGLTSLEEKGEAKRLAKMLCNLDLTKSHIWMAEKQECLHQPVIIHELGVIRGQLN